jgi:cytochrome oxidase Cu insertion factor (SCO1/SenC/PrrC family)
MKASAAVEGYAMSHTAFIYLIDPQFRLRLTFPFGIKSGDITSDLHYLIDHAQAD